MNQGKADAAKLTWHARKMGMKKAKVFLDLDGVFVANFGGNDNHALGKTVQDSLLRLRHLKKHKKGFSEGSTFDNLAGLTEACKTPGKKIRSKGKGKGLGVGGGEGPIGEPKAESIFDRMAGLIEEA